MSEVTKRQVPGDVFFEGLSEINEGALLEALDTKMTSLVSAVLATGNNGSLTLKLSVKRKGGVNQVVIEPKVTANIRIRRLPRALCLPIPPAPCIRTTPPRGNWTWMLL